MGQKNQVLLNKTLNSLFWNVMFTKTSSYKLFLHMHIFVCKFFDSVLGNFSAFFLLFFQPTLIKTFYKYYFSRILPQKVSTFFASMLNLFITTKLWFFVYNAWVIVFCYILYFSSLKKFKKKQLTNKKLITKYFLTYRAVLNRKQRRRRRFRSRLKNFF